MFEDEYTLSKQLGKGSFGEVYLTTKKGSSKKYATKILEKAKFSKSKKAKSYLDNELAILKVINHPNIVNLIETQETLKFCYIVTEYCNGGSLSSCLEQYQEKHGTAFPEEIVQHIMRQIMDAMKYLHEKKILHRDLKSDNILINYDDEDDKKNNNIIKGKIKIIDFGFARYLTKELAESAIGTPIYMDPGILQKLNKDKNYANYAYDEKADIWSLGIICYELLVGKSAYDAESMKELLKKIKKGTYTLPKNISKEYISFLNCMLQYDPKKRKSAKLLCSHKFLKNDVKTFTKINLKEFKKHVKGEKIQINSIVNQSIWNVFGDGIVESIMEETEESDDDGEINIDKKSITETCNSLTGSIFQDDNDDDNDNDNDKKKNKNKKKKSTIKPKPEKNDLDELFWKSFDEMNFDSISIQPKFAPFIPGMDFKMTNINII